MVGYCEKHGEYESMQIQVMGVVIRTTCPACLQNNLKQEKEELSAERKADLERRGISEEFFNATIESYNAESDSEKKALIATKSLISGDIHKLVLLGDCGTGKTHLACAAVKKLNGIRLTMFELGARIRACYATGKSDLDFLDSLLFFPVLAIDEIGRSKGSEAEKNWLSYLIDKAHTQKTRLILISNKKCVRSLPDGKKQEGFEFCFDNDVLSRLRQDSLIVEINGRDRRR